MAIRVVPPRRPISTSRRSPRQHALLPVIGPNDVILPTFDQSLGDFALRAQTGDREARDALYLAFRPKLSKMLTGVRAPFAPAGAEGLWTREDIEQEGYLAFVELIEAWTGEVTFTAYVLSRFTYRVRDVIQRGIGRPSAPPRHVTVPIQVAAGMPAFQAQTAEADAVMEGLLAMLKPPLDQVLARRVIDGASISQIAAELGVSRRTVSRYWIQCRAQAEAILEQARSHGHARKP
jgi:RNA polymerase sigma factor (sigma-70 family)